VFERLGYRLVATGGGLVFRFGHRLVATGCRR
jgi:hypothetical protein